MLESEVHNREVDPQGALTPRGSRPAGDCASRGQTGTYTRPVTGHQLGEPARLPGDRRPHCQAGRDPLDWPTRVPAPAMVGMALVKSLYCCPTWSRSHDWSTTTRASEPCSGALRASEPAIASRRSSVSTRGVWRIAWKPYSNRCAARCPGWARTSRSTGAIPAYGNGQRFVSKGGKLRERFSDPDASRGHRSSISTRRGGGYYGYKVHAAVCTTTGFPLAWEFRQREDSEIPSLDRLLDTITARGFAPEYATRQGLRRTIDLRSVRDTRYPADRPDAKEHPRRQPEQAPSCEHGVWKFAGADAKRGATKWRCPTAERKAASVWVKANRVHPLVHARLSAVQGALPPARSGRARVRTLEARMVPAAAARASDRTCATPRRSVDPRTARDRGSTTR